MIRNPRRSFRLSAVRLLLLQRNFLCSQQRFDVRFKTTAVLGALVCICFCAKTAPVIAPTPPMGWNSWDAYGLTINEAEFTANAKWMAANLKRYGWTLAVVDEGWYLVDPTVKPAQAQFVLSPD